MVAKRQCKKCGNSVIQLAPEGYCYICYEDIQNEGILKNIIQTEMPDGLVAFWDDSISYISKKQNRAYFRIPQSQKLRLLDGKKYRIIIKEI